MLQHLVPQIRKADLPAMLGVAVIGSTIAGCYGVLHDQITFTISPEYFTKLKFHQFAYADFGLGNRFFVGTIGFLATWWVGLVAGWFLARRLIPAQSRSVAFRKILKGIVLIFLVAIACGASGYVYGLWRESTGDYAAWGKLLRQLRIEEGWPFIRVAYIHNFGYLGGLVGLIVALVVIRPDKAKEC